MEEYTTRNLLGSNIVKLIRFSAYIEFIL